jgi:hypothetical protein
MSDKEIRADAKLKNRAEQDPEFAAEMWRFRHPEEGGEKLTLEAICAALPDFCGMSCSLSTLSEFYSWLRLKRRLDARANLADQLKTELAKDPDITEDQIRRAGQRLFMAEGIIEKDARVFADMVKIGQNETKLAQNDAKLKLSKKALAHDARRLELLEAKAARLDAAEAAIKEIKGDKDLTPEQQRKAVLDKMDEFFGLTKKN